MTLLAVVEREALGHERLLATSRNFLIPLRKSSEKVLDDLIFTGISCRPWRIRRFTSLPWVSR